MALGWFLHEWQTGHLQRAQTIADSITPNSPVRAAVEFLLDDRQSVRQLLEKYPDSASLVYFVAGERHLKAGRRDEGLSAFRRCLTTRQDEWLAASAEARLQELEPDEVQPLVGGAQK
jgi:hypothetical protein